MKLSRYWPLSVLRGEGGLSLRPVGRLFLRYWPFLMLVGAIVPVGVIWYRDSPAASPPGGKLAAEWIEHGNQALARGQLEQALDDFNKAVDAQPDSAKAHERRAAAYWQLKKPEQALNDCDLALRFDSQLASASFTRGLVERDLGDGDKALDDFTAALGNGLEGVDVLAARGALYHSKAKAIVKSDAAAKVLDEALKDFNRAVELAPHHAGCRVERAAVCVDLGDYETAVADCDAALEADPKLAVPRLAAVHVLRARAECELSEFDKAIGDADLAVSLDGSLIEAYVVRARARLEKSSEMRTLEEVAECRRVATDCQKAIELAKAMQGDAEAMQHAKTMRGLGHEFRGAIYQSLHARTKALAEYERALAQDPYLVSALLRRATARSTAADYAGALNDCNTAISIDSARAEAYSARGTVYAVRLEFPKAIEDFTQAVSLNRKCAKAYAGRALVYSAMAAIERKKADEMEKKLQQQPLLPATSSPEFKKQKELADEQHLADQTGLAKCLDDVKELWQKSIEDATAAIAANRHLASAYVTRALAYAKQRATANAMADFTAAIREDSKLAIAYDNRGVLLFNDHHLDAAIKDFEEAFRLQPASWQYAYRLYLCYQQKHDPVLAAQWLKTYQDNAKRLQPGVGAGLADAPSVLLAAPNKNPLLAPEPVDADPLKKAQKELEDLLDATAEK